MFYISVRIKNKTLKKTGSFERSEAFHEKKNVFITLCECLELQSLELEC